MVARAHRGAESRAKTEDGSRFEGSEEFQSDRRGRCKGDVPLRRSSDGTCACDDKVLEAGDAPDSGDGPRSLECDVRALYAAERDELRASQGDARDDLIAACVSACEREVEQMRGAPVDDRALMRSFARAQLRFIPRSTWAGLAGVALIVAAGANVLGTHALPQLFSAAGSLLALICLANVTRSRGFGMAELESSCRFNAVAVVLARMFAMGMGSVAILAVAGCSLGAAGVDALRCLLWMGAPYLVACAGGLTCARRVASCDTRTAAVAWSAGVVAISVVLYLVAPGAYASTALWLWALACVGSAAWLSVEVRAWIAASASGFVAGAQASRA